MSQLPTFFLFGATKSGTSSLFHYLKQHPDVFMSSVKEPHFFGYPEDSELVQIRNGEPKKNQYVITNRRAYEKLFAGAGDAKARGEASVMYIYLPDAPKRIHEAVPDARLFAVLRNPVERAYSAYLHMLRDDAEPEDTFMKALDAEPQRIAEGWAELYHYQTMGFYNQQLARYDAFFKPEQLKVLLYEDFAEDALGVTKEIYNFIGVDDSFVPDTSTKHNISGVPQNQLVHRVHKFLKGSSPLKTTFKKLLPAQTRSKMKRDMLAKVEASNLKKPPLSEEAKARLIDAYREDILGLQKRLGRDLSHWLQ